MGAPFLGAQQLQRMPQLEAIVHLGGTARWFLGDSPVLGRIAASNAGHVNSIPVAQFALALILLSGKNAIQIAAGYRAEQAEIDRGSLVLSGGNHGRTVGIVGASRVGRLLIEMLRAHSFTTLVHDPYLDDAEADALGVQAVALDELLAGSDVVSLHVPSLPSTRGMIGSRELGLIRDGGTLINTARGAIVDQPALLRELRTGRLTAYLDTTDPEILPNGHELYELPNTFLTPHIAGSTGNELRRLGATALSEVRRFVAGMPFEHPESLDAASGTPASARHLSIRPAPDPEELRMTAFDLTVPELERYEPVDYEPDDFDDFWTGTLAEAAAARPGCHVHAGRHRVDTVDTYDVTFAGYGGNPVRAWLRVPRGADGAVPVVVQYHGYNGGRGLAHDPALWPLAGFATLSVDTRGQGAGDQVGATPNPAPGTNPEHAGFMTRGGSSRRTTTTGACSPMLCRRSRPHARSPGSTRHGRS